MMATNDTSTRINEQHHCISPIQGSITITIGLFAPFHLLIIKCLTSRLRLRLPRHQILLSLSISDSIQLLSMLLVTMASFMFNVKTTAKTSCLVIRNIIQFIYFSTVVTSSGSIVALSIERYISCFHCFRVNEIMTKKRLRALFFSIWVLGGITGLATMYPITEHLTAEIATLTLGRLLLYMATVFSSTIIVVFTQLKLFLLSREKVRAQDRPHFGREREANDLRRRQLKIACSTCAVFAAYIIFMLPTALFMAIHFSSDRNQGSVTKRLRRLMSVISLMNAVADPFVYGLGMKDTREAIKRQLNIVKISACNRLWFLNLDY